MEIRYLDLGSVSPEIYTSLWEYDNVVELKEPTLIKFSTNKTLIQFWQGPYWDENTETWENNFTDLSNFYYSDELKGIPLCRCYIPIEINYTAEIAYYIASEHGTDFIVYLPEMDVLSEKHKRQEVDKIFQNIMVDVLAEKKIKSKIDGNDVLFYDNGKYRKFSGSLYRPAKHGYGYIDNGITYKFDSELANKLRNITNDTKIKKFDVEDISNVVGGLWEIDSSINKDELDFEVIHRLCYKLGYKLRHDKFHEEDLLFERGHRRLTEEKWYLYGNNDDFTDQM
tara:strand:+ start:1234 stop:2082 length:849 start_codon:yes stop_codon:yes gene_type:complete